MFITKLSLWTGIIKLFPAVETLVSDIPLGTGDSLSFFYSVATEHSINVIIMKKAAFILHNATRGTDT